MNMLEIEFWKKCPSNEGLILGESAKWKSGRVNLIFSPPYSHVYPMKLSIIYSKGSQLMYRF